MTGRRPVLKSNRFVSGISPALSSKSATFIQKTNWCLVCRLSSTHLNAQKYIIVQRDPNNWYPEWTKLTPNCGNRFAWVLGLEDPKTENSLKNSTPTTVGAPEPGCSVHFRARARHKAWEIKEDPAKGFTSSHGYGQMRIHQNHKPLDHPKWVMFDIV